MLNVEVWMLTLVISIFLALFMKKICSRNTHMPVNQKQELYNVRFLLKWNARGGKTLTCTCPFVVLQNQMLSSWRTPFWSSKWLAFLSTVLWELTYLVEIVMCDWIGSVILLFVKLFGSPLELFTWSKNCLLPVWRNSGIAGMSN